MKANKFLDYFLKLNNSSKMENEMKTIVEVIARLREKNYIHDFDISHTKLISKDTGEQFTPHDMIIDKSFRFEGDSNPDDMSILYSLTSNTGTKGILIDAYGTYANPDISAFIKDVPCADEVTTEAKA